MSNSDLKCGLCNCDPVRKGRKCCPEHNLIVCSCCKGTDRYMRLSCQAGGR